MRLISRLVGISAAAALALAATAHATAPAVRVHAIFGGRGMHVGQVLDVRATGRPKATRICWSPAPIERPACSASEDGAPSRAGLTKLTLTLPDGTRLSRTIRVSPRFTKVGGHGGSDAAPGHVTCSKLTLYGNTGTSGLHDKITTLDSGEAVAIYNKVGSNAIFVWHYADNKNGFADPGCVRPGPIGDLARQARSRSAGDRGA